MVNLQNLKQLTEQEISRKEFLQCIGVALLSFVGITHLLQSLHMGLNHPVKKTDRSMGYGSSAYGR